MLVCWGSDEQEVDSIFSAKLKAKASAESYQEWARYVS